MTNELTDQELIEKIESHYKASSVNPRINADWMELLSRFKSLTENRSELVKKSAEEIMIKHIPSGCINLKSYEKEKQAIIAAMEEYANTRTAANPLTVESVVEITKTDLEIAFNVFRYTPFPHNHPTFEEWYSNYFNTPNK